MNKLKEIHEFLKMQVVVLTEKKKGRNIDRDCSGETDYINGQCYEAKHILDTFEKVLYSDDKTYVTTNLDK